MVLKEKLWGEGLGEGRDGRWKDPHFSFSLARCGSSGGQPCHRANTPNPNKLCVLRRLS